MPTDLNHVVVESQQYLRNISRALGEVVGGQIATASSLEVPPLLPVLPGAHTR